MVLEKILADNFWYIFLAVFLLGTVLLLRTKSQRSLIIFLIRTKHGIKLLDKIGSISPRLWKFLGDLAIIISFGGLGVLYVYKYRKVYPFMLILGIISIIMLTPLVGSTMSAILFLILLSANLILNKINKQWTRYLYFLMTVIIMFSIFLGFTGSINPTINVYIISIITGLFGLPGLLVGSLISQASSILLQESSLPGISPLLPGVNQEGQIGFMFPGFDIFIPLWSGLIALIILLVTHEFSHGIMARVQGIRVKSMGLLTFGIIPIGAFVDPDEKDMEKKKSQEKMRVYSMGSFANLVVACVATILFLLISVNLSGMIQTDGIEIVSVQEGFPAEVLEPGTIIYKVNGVKVTNLAEYMEQAKYLVPGEEVILETDKGIFTLELAENPNNSSNAYLGFNLRTSVSLKPELENQQTMFSFLLGLSSALEIIFFLNLNVAIVNLLPIMPFDGFKMFEELLDSFKIKPKKRKKIINYVVTTVIVLLVLNALPLGNIFVKFFTGG